MPKWLKILLGASAVLAGFYALTLIPRHEPATSFPAPPAEINKISLSRPGAQLVLEKVDGLWRLRQPVDYPADGSNVASLLRSLEKMKVETQLTRRPESHGKYGVADAEAGKLEVWGPGAEKGVAWLLGKATPDGGSVYMRLPGQPEVYLAQGVHPDFVTLGLSEWRDRQLLPAAGDDAIVRVEVRRPAESWQVAKSSQGWTLDGRPTQEKAVEPLVQTLADARLDQFLDLPPADDLKQWGLARPSVTLRVHYASGKTVELKGGITSKAAAERILMQRDQERTLLWVSVGSLPMLSIKPEILLPPQRTVKQKS